MTLDELDSYPKVEKADNQNNSQRNFVTIGFLQVPLLMILTAVVLSELIIMCLLDQSLHQC